MDLDVQTDWWLGRVDKWFQGRGWCVKIGRGRGQNINLHAAIVCLANTIHWIDGSSDWCSFGCLIASCQSKSHRNIPGLPRGVFLIPWFIQILKILILPWRKLFRLLGFCISLIDWNKSKQLLLHCQDEMYNLASSFSFWFKWRKSWRVNLHVGSLFDLWKVICTISCPKPFWHDHHPYDSNWWGTL